jgi:ribonuclease HI
MKPNRGHEIFVASETLYFFDSHFIKYKVGLAMGTNNSTELLALRNLLKLAIEKGIDKMKFFSDCLLIINWIRGDSLSSH